MLGNRRYFVAVILSLLAGGCAKYQAMPLDTSVLRIDANKIQHPLLQSLLMNDGPGITPDQAGVIAVLINPALRAERDQRQLADAQLIEAGILPNPQLTFSEQIPDGGVSAGSINAYDLGLNWEITSLISRDAKIKAARANTSSVDLDIAWQEWQTAQAARSAAFDVIALEAELRQTTEIDRAMAENFRVIQSAVDRHEKTSLDAAAASAASDDAHTAVLSAQRDLEKARLQLNRAMGVPPEMPVRVRGDMDVPANFSLPTADEMERDVENRRLDLLALRLGYQSEEETLRAAILQQFPKISVGVDRSRDNSDVKYFGPGITVDLPIFDRNQGNIATEKATRQRLFDEYNQRVFEARADVADALSELSAIAGQISAAQQSRDSLRKLVESYRSAMTAGNLDVLGFYSAQQTLIQKELDILKLKADWMDTLLTLELAAGEIIPLPATEPSSMPATHPIPEAP